MQQLAQEGEKIGYSFALKDSEVGQELLQASVDEQKAFVVAAAEWLQHEKSSKTSYYARKGVEQAMLTLLRRKFLFSEDELLTLLDWCVQQQYHYYSNRVSVMVQATERYLQTHPRTSALQERIKQLLKVLEPYGHSAEIRKWMARLKELGEIRGQTNPIVAGEAWADAAISAIRGMDEAQQEAWNGLLATCSHATGAAPTNKWLKMAEQYLQRIGTQGFKDAVLAWFPLVNRDSNHLPVEVNADVLKGLVWLCAQCEDKEIARALAALAVSAYRKVPGVGPRCVRVGTACVWALGAMPSGDGIAQLAVLKVKVRFGTAQKVIDTAFAAAAERMGLSEGEIEELTVPDYGMQEVGVRREEFGEWTAELRVTGTTSTELSWVRADGKRQQSVPKAVKGEHAEALKELNQAAKDARTMLPAQNTRIENLYLAQKQWSFAAWRERYLDHPLMGVLARRLIWTFQQGDQRESGIWHEGRMVGQDGQPLAWLDDSTSVELWHPLQETTERVLAWREWLADREIQQPFKQAHREIYLLTDAEQTTRVYSNRFASHLLRQHQFNALCAARGWKNKLRLAMDDSYPPATRLLPAWGIRAEYWVEGTGGNYGTDTNESGTFLYLTTDQVRFYPIEAQANYAHSSGGGYRSGRWGPEAPIEPLPLDQIPPLVFSEVMRDVDLFVGVASVGNDPTWADGGREGRYRDYWASYSFGDLSETAKTRRYVLDRLVPRLKIADRCHVTDKFLMVRGELRTYKIHLGSGNILMEPNDQYLCIVPARGAATEGANGPMFLPFEGDGTLGVILSKAFLLAADREIKDPSITRQISLK
jgi:hypothetical protein